MEAAQARLDAMRTGRFAASKSKKVTIPISDKTQLDKCSILDYRSMKSNGGRNAPRPAALAKSENAVTPLPPPMVSSLWVAWVT